MEKGSSHKQQSFLYGTLILGVSTILVKILGAVFRIPLSNLIGSVGMGYFTTAYDIYLPIYSLAMAGLPIAVARLIAEQVAKKRYRDIKKTLKVVNATFMVTGLIGLIVMFVSALIVTGVANNSGALPAAFVIAPSIIFCCIISVYRGYYEGIRNMYPTAISNIIEAVCKLVLGYSFAFVAIKLYGNNENVLSVAAAAAMLGITLGSVFASIYLIIRYKKDDKNYSDVELSLSPEPQTSKQIFKALIVIAIPVAIGSLVNNVASLIDVAMVQRQIGSAVAKNPQVFRDMYGSFLVGNNNSVLKDSEIPNFLYGCYKGYAYTIFNLVPSITVVVGVSALPVLTMAWTEGNKSAIKANIESMLKVISLIAFPAGIGITALAPQIISLLYSAEDAVIAVNILRILGLAACFAGMTTPLTNMLQAIGKPSAPVKNIAVGAIIKIVVNYILVGVPEINILGAPIGTVMCYMYIAFADIYCLVKYSKIKPDFVKTLFKPLLAALVCGIAAYGSNALISLVFESRIVTLLSILIAVIAYVVAIAVLRCIDEEDVNTLPKGDKLIKIFNKMGIVRTKN